MNRTAEHNNRIGSAKVAPGMATRAADGHLKAAAAERFCNDGVGACAIEHHASLNRILPLGIGKNATHAPQIAFALFPYVADEQKRSSMRKIEICKRRGGCEQCGHARSIVGNARAVKLPALLPDIERGVCRKNCIQMGADGNDSPRDTRIAAENVANAIFVNLKQAE